MKIWHIITVETEHRRFYASNIDKFTNYVIAGSCEEAMAVINRVTCNGECNIQRIIESCSMVREVEDNQDGADIIHRAKLN